MSAWIRGVGVVVALVAFSATWQATYALGATNETIGWVLALAATATLSIRYAATGEI